MNIFEFASKYRLVGLVFVIWASYEVHYVVGQVFSNVAAITASVATALGIVFALPALAAGMIRWRFGDKFTTKGDEEK